MPNELGERVARLEEHIEHQNGTLDSIEAKQCSIEAKQDELGDDIQNLAECMACFRGIWTTAGIVFTAIVGWALAVFSKR